MAKLATINTDGTIWSTPLTYGVGNGDIIFSTWMNSDAVRNARRNGTASVLIDKADQPYAGVHYTGQAEVLSDDITADQYSEWLERYIGDYDQAVESYKFLVGLGIGERAFIRFRPAKALTWDFAKDAGLDENRPMLSAMSSGRHGPVKRPATETPLCSSINLDSRRARRPARFVRLTASGGFANSQRPLLEPDLHAPLFGSRSVR